MVKVIDWAQSAVFTAINEFGTFLVLFQHDAHQDDWRSTVWDLH